MTYTELKHATVLTIRLTSLHTRDKAQGKKHEHAALMLALLTCHLPETSFGSPALLVPVKEIFSPTLGVCCRIAGVNDVLDIDAATILCNIAWCRSL